MIFESVHWKEPLLASSERLRRSMALLEWGEDGYAQFERDVFIGFYTIRKLLEAVGKLSRSTIESRHRLLWFPKKPEAPPVDWYNRTEIWDLYELECKHGENRDLLYFSNRIIHSFVFIPSAAGFGDPEGFFFTSDIEKEKRLCFLQTTDVITMFDMVGSDYPEKLGAWRDAKTGEMKWST